MQIEIANKLDELPVAMAAMEEFAAGARLGRAPRHAMEVALDELLNNIISYGYRDAAEHRIQVELSADSDRLTIVISDDAVPFNPFERPPPDLNQSIEEREPGGFGIHIVRRLMDECAYRRCGERNIVTLCKYLAEN
jgi:sigma-B regulation protein RsbU (phosphoserine phosphatase)